VGKDRLVWGGIHLAFLIGFRNRFVLFFSWFWNWLVNSQDARLITGAPRLDLAVPRPADPGHAWSGLRIVPSPGIWALPGAVNIPCVSTPAFPAKRRAGTASKKVGSVR